MFSQRRSHYWSQQSRTFFFKGFSAKQQKKPKKAANYSVIEQNALSDKHPKMTSQNDRPDESLTGQAHDKAGHCLLTGHYFEPCLNTKWDLLRFLILPYSKMIYNKNILHLNNGGISSDSHKFWTANVRWLTVICSPEIHSANKKVLFHWCVHRRGQTEQS